MKDFSHYKKHVEVDMVKYSGNFHFSEQLKQEGTNIKINNVDTQIIEGQNKIIRAIVRNHGNEFNESKEERSVLISKEYDYKVGDYIEYLDDIYLTNSAIDKDNPFFNTTKITRCNYILKWMDNGILYEQPCIVVNNTKNTGGTKSLTSGLTEVDAMVNITIQANDNTKKIVYGKRLYAMKNAWRVTLIDDITTDNLFTWTLGKDSINSEVDDVINGICDAFEHNYTISLSSNSESIVETSTYQINAIVKDNNTVISNPKIIYKSSDETIATVNNGLITGLKQGSCVITCSIGNASVDLDLTVTAKTVTPVISYSCDWSTGKTSSGVSLKTYMSSTATCKETIDGVVNSALIVNYSLDSVGSTLLSTGAITITRKSNVDFLFKNVNVSTSKSFVITFTNSVDNSVISNQTVSLTGM